MTESMIRTVLIVTVVSLVLYFLNRKAKKNIQPNNGIYKLRMPKFYFYFGLFCCLVSLFILVLFIFKWENKFEVLLPVTFVFLFFGGSGIYLVLSMNHRVEFGERVIKITNARGKTFETTWTEINAVTFSIFSGYITLQTLKGKGKIHFHMIGLKKFNEMLKNKTQLELPSTNKMFNG